MISVGDGASWKENQRDAYCKKDGKVTSLQSNVLLQSHQYETLQTDFASVTSHHGDFSVIQSPLGRPKESHNSFES